MMHSSLLFSLQMKRSMESKIMLRKNPWMLLLRERRLGLLQIPLPWTLKPRNDLQTNSVFSSFYDEYCFSSRFLAYMPVSSSTISIVSCMDIKTNSGFDSRCLEPNFASEHGNIFCRPN